MVRVLSIVALFAVALCVPKFANAHSEFKKMMEKEYSNLKVTCNACHEKGKKKDVRNEFGKAIHKKFESEKFSEKLSQIKDREEKKKYMEDKVLPVVTKAMKEVVDKEKDSAGNSWADQVKNGTLPGVKLKD